jgi:hypothetical protein
VRTGLTAKHLLSGVGRAGAPAAEATAAEASLLSRTGSASRAAVSMVSRLASGAATDTMGFIRGTATGPFSAIKGLGYATTVLTAVMLANDAYAFARSTLDENAQKELAQKLQADGVLSPDGTINYEKAGYMIRNAKPALPAEDKKRFCELVVYGMLDASLKIDPNAPDGYVDNRKYEVNVSPSESHQKDQDASYMNLYGVPFQVKHTGEKVVITFMNGPVHPHEQQRIIHAFNAMGMDAEVKMDADAQRRYKEMWAEYASDDHMLDNNWVGTEAKARGIAPLAGGQPDRVKFIESLRSEYMILTGITDPKDINIPLRIRQTT